MRKSQLKSRFRSALLVSSLALFTPAFAQNLPGEAIDTPTVPGAVQTLMNRAQQAYPSTLPSASASSWRMYQGIQYKYFSTTGIFVGVKDGQVYLYGGPFTTVTPYGTVAAVTAALEARIANPPAQNPGTATADFGGYIAARTLKDLIARFSSLTMEYYSGFGTTIATTQIKLDVVGQESIGGVSTDHLKYTISSGSSNLVYDFWVDASGNFQQVSAGSFVYPSAQAQLLGPSFVSAFTAALAAGDNAQLAAALSGELKNPALSTKVTKRIVGNIEADTIKVEVSANGALVTGYVSDFGNFTMLTEFSSQVSTLRSGFEIIDMRLR